MARTKKDNIERKPFTTLLPREIIKEMQKLKISDDKDNLYEVLEEALIIYLDLIKKVPGLKAPRVQENETYRLVKRAMDSFEGKKKDRGTTR